ncbi:MAG: flagellar motor switch protein FliM [Verrucomicrobiota bacterium]|nr:flagellar motor switch protein FliM [Verrucomicrobiota bacterium]MEC8657138.1 flagellar motor switch protein FliM [Verrucomicrobiota bacterium]MEC8790389.1 flagellar motor switch protein FliM [Verrucomicrobiota bacterium]MED5281524.1 flagellar motor switch protein FliM [Verrucomicrobiota bacterium]MEE3061661.1 flagellar motor switch protein FliM [Verrucomicrobiota bacterium]
MPEDSNFEDESFDLSEIEDSVGTGPIFHYDGTRIEDDSSISVKKYDFTNPIILSDADLSKLKTKSEQFVYYLAGHLSMFLRTEFNLELDDLNADLYVNFTQSVKTPSCVTLFKLQELNGVCLLDVNSHLSATVVDRILGGRGSTNPEERGLTDIEKALVEDFNQIILEEWCKQWEGIMSLTPSIIGTESTGKFLQTSPTDAMMLILTMEASFGDVSGPLRIAVPYYTMEPVLSRLLMAAANEEKQVSRPPRWHDIYDDIPVAVSAEWDAFDVTLRDLANLSVDDVIEMSPDLLGNTKLRIEGRTCFIGEIGLEGEQVAFQVNESIGEAVKLIGKKHG